MRLSCSHRPFACRADTSVIARATLSTAAEFTVLSGATFRDRLRILGLLAARGGRRTRWTLALPMRIARRLRTSTPERLLIAPQDIRTGDPTVADDIGSGYFAFGGKIVSAQGRSPFLLEPGSPAWARQLNGFGWLRHLRVAPTAQTKAQAALLVDQFLRASGRPDAGVAWEPRVAARRMLAWLSQSPIILEGSDRVFYGRFMQALADHRAFLERRISQDAGGSDRLLTAIALAEFSLCVPEVEALQRQGTAVLAAEITAQILADGGTLTRNPQNVIDLLLDLLPLRQAYAARGVPAPPPLLNAIDRMVPMLRLFRHGDGTLALFNGMGLTAPELVATILAYDDARGLPLLNAPYSGYQRVEADAAVLIAEAGAAPPQPFSAQAHAGCLSFEFSSGIQRLIVNCGAPDLTRASAREAARATAAHSTLTVDDTSSCRFAAHAGLQKWLGDQILAGPAVVTAERLQEGSATTLRLSHDGYAARFGLVHARDLTLAADGMSLEGRDALEAVDKRAAEAVGYAIRFHLHPSVKARPVGDERAVLLECPGGEQWLFRADEPLTVEPSILFAASGGPRPTSQIRIGMGVGSRRVVHWALGRRPTRAA